MKKDVIGSKRNRRIVVGAVGLLLVVALVASLVTSVGAVPQLRAGTDMA